MSARQGRALAERQPRTLPLDHAGRGGLLVQRHGSGTPDLGRHVADTLSTGGTTLAPDVRGDMEQRFGRDFGNVRVHDDARAHDSARQASAAAYTVGDHIVFGAGRYRPDSQAGRGLLAHELAHTVQQAGLQRRGLDGIQAGDDAALEAEADRAAGAALRGHPVPALTTLSAPRLARAPDDVSSETGAGPTDTPQDDSPALRAKLSAIPNVTAVSEQHNSKAGKQVAVTLSTYASDLPKGPADRTNALLTRRGTEKSLVFATAVNARKALVKETGADTKFYTGAWLSKYGYPSLKQLGSKLQAYRKTDAGKAESKPIGDHIDKLAAAFAQERLTGAGGTKFDANVDHIVEKQVQGQSIAENMQLLNAEENQAAGSALNKKIVATANDILAALADNDIKAIRLQFGNIVYPAGGAQDGITRIEELLKDGTALKGDLSAAAMAGTKTRLVSGGSSATIHVGKGPTEIANNGSNDLARYLIPTLNLVSYHRGGKNDTVKASINPARLTAIIPVPGQEINLLATAGEAAPGAGAATGEGAAAGAAESESAALPVRKLSIPPGKADYKFVFPYLSPGRFTRFGLDEKGGLTAVGSITPSIKFLKEIGVKIEGGEFSLLADLGPENFQPPFDGLRVTEAALKMQLAPQFRPSGNFGFEVGPKGKPYVLGKVTAGLEGGAFVAHGDLTGQNIPGVSDAKGKVRYSAVDGWSGQVSASTSKLPAVKQAQVTFGFSSGPDGTARLYAGGGISFDIGKGKDLTISANYAGGAMIYSGKLEWEKPIRLVDKVTLHFTYDGTTLRGTGQVPVTYTRAGASFTGDLTVSYVRKGEEEGKIFGTGKLGVKTAKAEGHLVINVSEKGAIWGEGSVAYQINDKIRPTVGVKLTPEGKITLLGKIELTKPIVLFPAKGGERDLIKVNVDFIIPGPFPGLADPMVHLGAGVRFTYGIGPGQIVNTVIEGSFDPFEEDMNAKLRFTSTFEVPAKVGLTGILEAGLGIAVLGGIGAKVHGGLRLEPGFELKLTTSIPVEAQYANGDFEFSGKVEMTGGLSLGLGIKFYAHVEALAGAASKDFDWTIKNYSYDAAQQMKLTLAKLGYSTKTGPKWPDLNDIAIEPKGLDPIAMIRKAAQSAKAALGG
jgi:hypothetical protein